MTVVDAHTCPMLVTLPNTQCETVSCLSPPYLGIRPDKSLLCPAENLLLLEGTSTPLGCVNIEQIIGCVSDCKRLGTSQACCEDQFNSPSTCTATNPWFKEACPNAYSYAYDDLTATKHCKSCGHCSRPPLSENIKSLEFCNFTAHELKPINLVTD